MYFRCKCILVHTQTKCTEFLLCFWVNLPVVCNMMSMCFLDKLKNLEIFRQEQKTNIANTENIYKSSLKQTDVCVFLLYKDKRL